MMIFTIFIPLANIPTRSAKIKLQMISEGTKHHSFWFFLKTQSNLLKCSLLPHHLLRQLLPLLLTTLHNLRLLLWVHHINFFAFETVIVSLHFH